MNRHFSPQRGFAVVLVLIAIGLAGAMAVLFLSSVASERRGVNLYSRQSQARHLAETAVNLVLTQINNATKEGIGTGQWISWASQPGMIRTYNSSGALSNAYKLYSWDNLVEAGTAFNPVSGAEVPSATWVSQPAFFTDLNAPINNVYPIVDPAAMSKVEGFRIDASNPVATAATTGSAPMPVKWLYILQDGSYVTPSGGSGVQATVPGASGTNPIVGRIAFWTDDETAKVNINTASEGAYWDWPKGASADELQFAANPPVKGEYQRISGHSATTCISPVLPELRKGGASRWSSNSANSTYLTELQNLYGMTPRIEWGGNGDGSQGGTQPVSSYSQSYTFAASGTNYATPDVITADSDRLYATADDFWFQPGRAANTALSNAGLTAADLSKRLFFLTANSRAPETTLFETPRISLWPITWPNPSSFWSKLASISTSNSAFSGRHGTAPTVVAPTSSLTSNKWLTPQENLLAFCSTLNASGTAGAGPRYFFQRQQPDSPTADWAIQRNQQLVTYLRSAFDQRVPGFGCSPASKWGSDNADWIALNCFDYARSQVNQTTKESTPANPIVAGKNELGYSYTGLSARSIWISGANNGNYYEPNSFTVTPLRADFNGKTYVTEGAYPTLDQVSLVFYATDRNEPAAPGSTGTNANGTYINPNRDGSAASIANPANWVNLINVTGTGGNPAAPAGMKVSCQTTSMRAVMLFHFSGLSQVLSYAPVFWIKVTGSPFSVNGSGINLPDSSGRSLVQWNSMDRGVLMNRNFFPLYDYTGSVNTLVPKVFANPAETGSSGANVWTLTSSPISINAASDSFTFPFRGSKITVSIYAPDPTNLNTDPTGDSSKLVSSQDVDFSSWNVDLPIPVAPRWNVRDGATKPTVANTWAGGENVPEIDWSKEPPAATATALSNRPIVYAYCAGTSTNKISTDFAQRLKLMLGRNTINSTGGGPTQLFAEGRTASSGTDRAYDLRYTTTDFSNVQGASLITPYDTVISMVASPDDNSGGDPRVVKTGSTAFKRIDNLSAFSGATSNELFSSTAYPRTTAKQQFHALGSPGNEPMATGYRTAPKFQNSTALATSGYASVTLNQMGNATTNPSSLGWIGDETNVTMNLDPTWDWTSMPGNSRDGGFVNRPDQDYQSLYVDSSASSYVTVPYFQVYGQYSSSGTAYFMPNRQIPSPVMLGTLPSSLTQGWQTLCFCPNPGQGSSHPGLGTANPPSATGSPFSAAPDHLLLDFFWMPVAEPYPISEQFSTAGKVNLNYALAPFSYIQNGGTSYIQRKTALDAVLKPVWINAMRQNTAPDYKSWYNMSKYSSSDQHTRYPINIDETLKAFDYKFLQGDIFRSASQICEMFLYPNDPSDTSDPVPPLMSANSPLKTWDSANSNIKTWWNNYTLTSDNGREEPYNAIYSRVTTKSNTYTVHWRVQALRKGTGNQGVWDDAHDAVQSELRGSTLVERYLDPNATNIPDYAANTNYFSAPGDVKPMSAYYKWRIVTENYFQP
ncbi:MAG: Verru_Chthon cassette protein A [Chthoniobacteraceae bacterium]